MAVDVFYVPIFFIVLRETIEAAIIVSVLLSFVEQLMQSGTFDSTPLTNADGTPAEEDPEVTSARLKRILKRMRIQIWAGTLLGFFIALAIGAAFIAVFYTKLTDLWAKTEQIWEGIFSIIASIIIYIMGLAFLKMDRSRIKWRIKLAEAFDDHAARALRAHGHVSGQPTIDDAALELTPEQEKEMKRRARSGKWALFILPMITVLREGLEAIVFVGGVSLDTTAKAIPLPVVVGLIAGCFIGWLLYRGGSTVALHWFLIISTCILFLVGAGLFSKGTAFFEYYRFAAGVGSDVSESGNGPGSFQVKGNVWHLTYGNPETGAVGTNGGWQIFNAILGWNNEANLGSILSYVFYWIAIIAALVVIKWKEGRVTFFGKGSAAYHRLQANKAARQVEKLSPTPSSENTEGTKEKVQGSPELPTAVLAKN